MVALAWSDMLMILLSQPETKEVSKKPKSRFNNGYQKEDKLGVENIQCFVNISKFFSIPLRLFKPVIKILIAVSMTQTK